MNSVSRESRAICVKVAAGIALLTILIFSPLLDAGFLSLDDTYLITENKAVLHPSYASLRTIFTTYDPELYIPATLLSYQADRIVFGMSSFFFHLHNIVLHLLAGTLVYFIARKLLRSVFPALFLALFFLVHPIQAEAVSWLSARKDLQSSFFMLAALACALHWDTAHPVRPRQWRVGTIFFFTLALLSKVSVCVFPLILLLIRSYRGEKGRLHLPTYCVLSMLSILFIVVAVLGKTVGISHLGFVDTFFVTVQSILSLLARLFFPLHLSPIYLYEHGWKLFSLTGGSALLFLSMVIGSCVLLWKRHPLGYCSMTFFVLLAPSIVTYWKDGVLYLASDRYAYLAIIPFGYALLYGVHKLFLCVPKQQKAMFFAGVVIVFLLSLRTFLQTMVWHSDHSLFTHILRREPTSHIAHTNLGNVFRAQHDGKRALAEYLAALEAKNDYAPAYRNIGSLFIETKHPENALSYYEQAIAISPDAAEGYYGIGIAYTHLQRFFDAEKALRKALELDPHFMDAYLALGNVYFQTKRTSEEQMIYEEALRIDPLYKPAAENLAILLQEKHQ